MNGAPSTMGLPEEADGGAATVAEDGVEVVSHLDAETVFESYLDHGSGEWTIRRISATPPACESEDAG